jgi:lipoprotein-releasing system ATP-binding protein
MSFIEVDNVTRIFATEHEPHVALKEVSFKLEAGTTLAVCGPSGSGKSTLLGLLGGLDRPNEGTVVVAGQEVSHLSAAAEATYRNTVTGFVFQFHHLLRDFDILENVMMPLLIRGEARSEASLRAKAILAKVGLADLVERRPGELSGGEQQRAASDGLKQRMNSNAFRMP